MKTLPCNRYRTQHERRLRKLQRSLIESVNKSKSPQKKNEIDLSAFSTVFNHFEKTSSQIVKGKQSSKVFSKNHLEQSTERLISTTQRLRTSIGEIHRGIRKEYNFRLIYECLKVIS